MIEVNSYVDENPYFTGYDVDQILEDLFADTEDHVDIVVHVTMDEDLDGDRGGAVHSVDLELTEYGDVEVHHAEVFICPNACTSERDVLETLCHELIHVKQYVTGLLKEDYNRLGFVWLDRPWTYVFIPFSELTSDAPWEIEAEEQGMKLFAKYFAKSVDI